MADDGSLADWLRLTLVRGIGAASQRALLRAFGLPAAIFSAPQSALASVVGEASARALRDADPGQEVAEALAWAAEPGRHILTLADQAYPPALLETPDPPTVLYVQGDPSLLARPAIAIVGSRNATPGGVKTAEAFARALVAAERVVVSGLALGIDTAAHRGALAAGGGTVAVIGTGCDRIYPARNRELAHEIVAHGAIVSEFRLGTPALAANFPRRNRIIAGLGQGVLVVEAALRSGSLITARLAGDFGREVFAVPGSIHSPLAKGCHALIRQGAKLVETAQDVLEELGASGAEMLPAALQSPPEGEPGTVLAALGHDPCAVDEIAARTGLTAEALLAILFELELGGHIACLAGGRFQRIA